MICIVYLHIILYANFIVYYILYIIKRVNLFITRQKNLTMYGDGC